MTSSGPRISILAEPAVAVVDKNVDAHRTRPAAAAYLQYLYSPEGQAIAARHFYRPHNAAVARQYAGQFPPIRLFTAEQVFGGWDAIQKAHFADGAIFDQISLQSLATFLLAFVDNCGYLWGRRFRPPTTFLKSNATYEAETSFPPCSVAAFAVALTGCSPQKTAD